MCDSIVLFAKGVYQAAATRREKSHACRCVVHVHHASKLPRDAIRMENATRKLLGNLWKRCVIYSTAKLNLIFLLKCVKTKEEIILYWKAVTATSFQHNSLLLILHFSLLVGLNTICFYAFTFPGRATMKPYCVSLKTNRITRSDYCEQLSKPPPKLYNCFRSPCKE